MKSLYVPMMDLYLIFQFITDVAMATKNVDEMKANRYYMHSLHVRQMAAWFHFATTYY